ncbi:unnamed protein product, partial [Adineta ricciae]
MCIEEKINSQLIRYKDTIEEKKLLRTLSAYVLTDHQKEAIERLKNVRQMQLNVFEDLLKLETQVSMEYLPTNFNRIDNFIRPNLYSPIVQDQLAVELKQKQFKNIQEAKRAWLNIYIDIYEVQYQEYDQHYQKEFNQFQVISLNNGQKHGVDLFNSFMTYINHRTDRIKQEIYSEKISIYRRKLVRRLRRRHKKDLRSK